MIQTETGEPSLDFVSFVGCLATGNQKNVFKLQSTKYLAHSLKQIVFGGRQRHTEIIHDLLPFSVAQGIF